MKDDSTLLATILVIMMVGAFIAGAIISHNYGSTDEIAEAIQQCEQNLPRNQHCEPVISARVVEE